MCDNVEKILETKAGRLSPSEHLRKGAKASIPVAVIGSVTVSLAYLIDIVYMGISTAGIGENTQVARVLFGLGSIILRLIFPVLSAGIAMSIGGLYALSAGLIGGMLAGIGSTITFPSGDSSAISGIFGSILAGFAAGYSVILISKLRESLKGDKKYVAEILLPIVPIILSAIATLCINPIAGAINALTSTALAGLSRVSFLLVSAMVGLMMTADVGGPLYLSAYVFGAASIFTGDPEIMASVMAAGMVPPLSIFLCAAVFKEKFSKKERLAGYVSFLCGVMGVSHGAIPYYAARPLRIIPPCMAGGVAASMLSMVFGCSTELPVGGFLALSAMDMPLYFSLSVLCGTFISAAIMGVSLNTVDVPEKDTFNRDNTMVQGAPA